MTAGPALSHDIDHDVAELNAGRPVQIGSLTLTAPPGGGITITDRHGHSSTYSTFADFDAAVQQAQAFRAALTPTPSS